MNEAHTRQFRALAKAMAEMSRAHWDDFVESRGSEGASFAEWRPVFLRDMRDLWRDEFPKPEEWRIIRKLIVDPLLKYVEREHLKPGERTVVTRHMTVGQFLDAADYKLETGHPRAEVYVAAARKVMQRSGGDLDAPLISFADQRWDGMDRLK